ncbi:hypothetical protein D4764_0179130 [Takifugu flavidus]|uniref:Uncharacterized protein n=1 Tax=Takifugu flavidus TaxID=433684 RepID=A0A5C6MI99_9TELE|nr:hypothetical protein D4764_0179130 [Takifugu flavidus]
MRGNLSLVTKKGILLGTSLARPGDRTSRDDPGQQGPTGQTEANPGQPEATRASLALARPGPAWRDPGQPEATRASLRRPGPAWRDPGQPETTRASLM